MYSKAYLMHPVLDLDGHSFLGQGVYIYVHVYMYKKSRKFEMLGICRGSLIFHN